ncbi:hypothetical protein QWZ08_12235 [Ferruginibacter paludis]|uniref:hypothetical protein n=1 Tax=Ferruginibacter paludis TaxID=1310417 RepID=UPI0025B552B7|nr:hypothetical protein [Ferruginibacter paludis]MDN3656403.1 hypothetical protein [Ferruginibacter paludis]
MKIAVTFFLSALLHMQGYTQPDSSRVEKYDAVVSFGSMCCGPVSDDFLKNFTQQFNKKNKITIQAWQITGCGREGEFKVLFSLAKLKIATKRKFLTGLRKLVSNQNDKNKKLKASSGPVSIDYNFPKTELPNCRGDIVKWK